MRNVKIKRPKQKGDNDEPLQSNRRKRMAISKNQQLAYRFIRKYGRYFHLAMFREHTRAVQRFILEGVWSEIVKAKADYKSELSGKTEKLVAHHLIGKSCDRLRFLETLNGVCCTSGEHQFGFHHASRRIDYEIIIKHQRGEDIFERLKILEKQSQGKVDYMAAAIYLQNELKKYV